ncbi:MAG: PAS domain-containing protein [Deltaproteobacteria bacterium]|nr:PAS domain-containing protein [Deltaproteobacteria bacterium]
MIIIELISNLAILIALSIVSGFIGHRWKRATIIGGMLQGLLFGSVAVIGMLRPLILDSGLIFDGRSVMLSLCGLFFGPTAVAIAGLMTITCRILQGGLGTLTGVLVIVSSALTGVFFHFRRHTSETDFSSPSHLFVFGLLVNVLMLGLMFTLPMDIALRILERIGLPMLVTYPLATVLIGSILSDQDVHRRFVEALKQKEEYFRTLVENIPGAVYRCEAQIPFRVILMSGGVYNLTGRMSADFMSGLIPWPDIVVPDDLAAVTQNIKAAIKMKTPYSLEYRVKHLDGGYRWVNETGQCKYDSNNNPICLDGVFSMSPHENRLKKHSGKARKNTVSCWMKPWTRFFIFTRMEDIVMPTALLPRKSANL